ncbi:MAG: tetratricopeptide repeat protein [Chloroflexi bacterium]|nr:tetratricopeptide repeat protein [Chloroflexota bacterium]
MFAIARPLDWQDVPRERQAAVREALASSRQHLAGGRLLAALDDCFLAIALAPGFLPAHARVAEITGLRGDQAGAAATYSLLLDVALLRGRIDDALEAFRRLVAHSSDDPNAQTRLVRLLLQPGQVKAAADRSLLLAETSMQSGDWAQASAAFQAVLEVAPNAFLAHYRYGEALVRVGRAAEAVPVLQRALALAPDEVRVQMALCLAAERAGALALAGTVFGRLVERLRANRDEVDLALAAFKASGQRPEHVPQCSLWLALLLPELGQGAEAAPLLQAALADPMVGDLARVALVGQHLAAGRLAESLLVLQRTGKAQPEQVRALRPAVEHFLPGDQWETAVALLGELRRLDPTDETLTVRLAEVSFKRGRLVAARREFQVLAELYARRGQVGKALEIRRVVDELGKRQGVG